MAKKSAPPITDESSESTEQVVEAPAKNVAWTPTYQHKAEFDSHLFELKTAKMLKNASWSSETPDIRALDHQHFFHTFDSSGREQVHSTATGGHFHVITVSKGKNGEPIAKCSGPKIYAHKKGKKFVVDAPQFKAIDNETGENIKDDHTHETIYQRSSTVKPRTVNAESLKVVDILESTKEQRIPGIQG